MSQCQSCHAPIVGAHGNRRYCSSTCRYRADSRRKQSRIRQSRVAQPRPLPVVDPADLGWLAGIIDGEGSVALSHGGSGTPHLRVQITNGSASILDKVRSIFRISDLKWTELRDRRGTVNMTVGGADALMLHRLVRPLLVRQVAQYDAAVTFLRKKYDDGRLRVFWTDAERAEWESLRARFHPNARLR